MTIYEAINNENMIRLMIVDNEKTRKFIEEVSYVVSGQNLSGGYKIIYIPKDKYNEVVTYYEVEFYCVFPQVLGLLDSDVINDIGANTIQRPNGLDTRGLGVLVGGIEIIGLI